MSDRDTKKPKINKFKKRSEHLRSGDEGKLKNRINLEWRLDCDRVSEAFGGTSEFVGIDELKETLKQSRTGKALLSAEIVEGLNIYFDPQVSVSQYYPEMGVITLNPHQPKAELVILLTKELRKNWQYKNGLLFNPLSFDPNEAILLNRSQQADCLLLAIRVAWEIKLDGDNTVWDYLAVSSSSDVMRTFEIHAKSDFRSLNNGKAVRAAYDKWFEEDRIKTNDKNVIHQMLLDETVYALETEQTKRAVDDSLLIQMADMPCGQNYLSLSGHKQPTHEDYAAVDDRSNANFLWFIKFERSFQEKERQMLEAPVPCSADVIDFASKAKQAKQQNWAN